MLQFFITYKSMINMSLLIKSLFTLIATQVRPLLNDCLEQGRNKCKHEKYICQQFNTKHNIYTYSKGESGGQPITKVENKDIQLKKMLEY